MPRKQRKELQQLRAQLFNQPWAIHSPAFYSLLDVTSNREAFDAAEPADVRAQLGINEEYPNETRYIGNVAVISLQGVLVDRVDRIRMRYFGEHSYQVFERDFKAAIDNSQVRGVLILCNSPGGSAAGCTRAAELVYRARGTKPIHAYCHFMTASACYYVAAASDRITTHADSMIGSIGTIYVHTEYSAALDEFGIKPTVITHGERKGDGNPYEPLTDGARAALQRMVSSYGEPFERDVARYRGVSLDTVREQYGQGEAFRGDVALTRGLVDAIVPNFDAALAALTTLAGGSPGATGTARGATGLASAFPNGETSHTSNQLITQGNTGQASGTQPTTSTTSTIQPKTNEGQMKTRIIAALVAKGLIDSHNVDDATYNAAVRGYFRGNVPASEADILAGLMAAEPSAASPQTAVGSAATSGTACEQAVAPNVQAAHNREQAEAQAVNGERNRVLELQAKAATLSSTGFVVSAEQLAHAIANNTTVADAANLWTTPAAQSGTGGASGTQATAAEAPIRISPVSASVDNFQAAAVEAVASRVRPQTRTATATQAAPLTPAARDMANTPLWAIAMQDLQLRGQRVSQNATFDKGARIEMCSRWLAAGGQYALPSAQAGGAAQTVADFPNLAGSLVARILDQAIELSDATYRQWTARVPDLPDLRPQLIVAYGGLNTLDQIGDDEKAPQLKFTEETPGWMQIGRYANKVALTAVMMANNDLDMWSQGLNSLGQLVERTVNRLCLALLTGNVTLLDGNALFDDTNHGNDVTTGGGVPSAAQATIMKKRHRRQSGIGAIGRVKTPPSIALVPTEHEEAADATFLLNAALGEVLTKTTDTSLNTHRGKVRPVVEPDLEDASTNVWYTLADPAIRRTIVHGFMEGFGDGGRRTSWYEPDEDTRYTKIEVAAAAAVAGFRGIVRNSGTA